MPKLSEIAKNRETKKFVKKDYRSWNLSGDGLSVDTSSSQEDYSASKLIKEQVVEPIIFSEALTIKANLNLDKQIDNDLDIEKNNKQVTKKQQTGNKKVTNRQLTDNIQTTKEPQQDNNIDNNIDNKLDVSYYIEQIKRLSGIQEKLFNYIVDLCSNRSQLQTGPLLTTELSYIGNCSLGSVKTSLERLTKKYLLLRQKGKPSRGGFLNLAITREIQTAALQAKNFKEGLIKKYSNHPKIDNNIDNNLDNNGFSISSSNKSKNTTTSLPADWLEIDFSDLSHIGFSHTQLMQIYSKNVSIPESVQESINHFAFALIHNEKAKAYSDPLNVLMGVLRKGGMWVEKNYRSPKEIAQQLLIEQKKAEKERKKHQIEEAYKLALSEWQENLSQAEIELIAERKGERDIMPQSAKLNIFFKNTIWPNKKKEYLILEE